MQTIKFHYNSSFRLKEAGKYSAWISNVIIGENRLVGNINYIFTIDRELLDMNRQFLDHDSYTDILTFDYSEDNAISGDIFISIDRVRDNARIFKTHTEEELRRVMVHGILHLIGYTDGTEEEKKIIREIENQKMKMFHVEL